MKKDWAVRIGSAALTLNMFFTHAAHAIVEPGQSRAPLLLSALPKPDVQRRLSSTFQICPDDGHFTDNRKITPQQDRQRASLCLHYWYGQFICKADSENYTAMISQATGGRIDASTGNIDAISFPEKDNPDMRIGRFLNFFRHMKLRQAKVHPMKLIWNMIDWDQKAERLLDKEYLKIMHNEKTEIRNGVDVILAAIHSPDFQKSCPYIMPNDSHLANMPQVKKPVRKKFGVIKKYMPRAVRNAKTAPHWSKAAHMAGPR